MSQAAVQAFVDRINEDETFRDQLVAAGSHDARLQMAQDAGFDVSADDLAELRRQNNVEELSEDDLQKIAGGADTTGTEVAAVTITVSVAVAQAAAWV